MTLRITQLSTTQYRATYGARSIKGTLDECVQWTYYQQRMEMTQHDSPLSNLYQHQQSAQPAAPIHHRDDSANGQAAEQPDLHG